MTRISANQNQEFQRHVGNNSAGSPVQLPPSGIRVDSRDSQAFF
jgi:hypothetical protein